MLVKSAAIQGIISNAGVFFTISSYNSRNGSIATVQIECNVYKPTNNCNHVILISPNLPELVRDHPSLTG